jgi:L-threonylcarbamoyladenylate synthase
MIYWNDTDSIQQLKTILDKNEIVLASGDTVLGLWSNLTQQAFDTMNQIKQRYDKPYLITIASANKLSHFIDQPITEKLQTLIETCWPGPVTLVFKARKDLPTWMVSQEGTIALRVPDHDGLLKLLSHFDGLFSTSANIHGQSIVNCVDQIDSSIVENVAMVCADREQHCYSKSPSTILDCSSGDIQVVRSGAFGVEKLQDLLT